MQVLQSITCHFIICVYAKFVSVSQAFAFDSLTVERQEYLAYKTSFIRFPGIIFLSSECI